MKKINLLKTFPEIFRNVDSRKKNKKKNRKLALGFSKDYFDGSRNSGYGGYYYDGRWVNVAKYIIKKYKLKKKFKNFRCWVCKRFFNVRFVENFKK